jgi:hypothetical protein
MSLLIQHAPSLLAGCCQHTGHYIRVVPGDRSDSKGNADWAKLIGRDEGLQLVQETLDKGYIAIGLAVFKFDSRGNIGKNSNCLTDYDPETVVPPFEVEVTDITKEVKIEPELSFGSELINLSFIAKDVQVTTICDGKWRICLS